MTQIEAITKLHDALTDFPEVASIYPPDTNPGEWAVLYDSRIWITWEPKKELYRVLIFHELHVIKLGYYPFDALLTVLKFATL